MRRTATGYAGHRGELLSRLSKMEGQVRGIARMVEGDRYCLDIVTQIQALTAAAREVEVLVLEDHLRGCVRDAAGGEDAGDAAIAEMTRVLRRTLRP